MSFWQATGRNKSKIEPIKANVFLTKYQTSLSHQRLMKIFVANPILSAWTPQCISRKILVSLKAAYSSVWATLASSHPKGSTDMVSLCITVLPLFHRKLQGVKVVEINSIQPRRNTVGFVTPHFTLWSMMGSDSMQWHSSNSPMNVLCNGHRSNKPHW